MTVKLDLAKAYDKISWEFLEKLMFGMGFFELWTSRTMTYVSSSDLAVMVNG